MPKLNTVSSSGMFALKFSVVAEAFCQISEICPNDSFLGARPPSFFLAMVQNITFLLIYTGISPLSRLIFANEGDFQNGDVELWC